MTKKISLSLAACVASVSLLSACGAAANDPASPAGRYEAGVKAGATKDYAGLCDVFDPQMVKQMEDTSSKKCEEMFAANPKLMEDMAKYKDVSVDASKVKVEGDTATIPGDAVTVTKENGDKATEPSDIKMVRRDGAWYLSLT